MALRESQLEREFVTSVHARGGLARKFVSPNRRGVPDQIIVWPGGHIHFVELKAELGKLTKLQQREQQRLTDAECTVHTLYGKRGVERYLLGMAVEGLSA